MRACVRACVRVCVCVGGGGAFIFTEQQNVRGTGFDGITNLEGAMELRLHSLFLQYSTTLLSLCRDICFTFVVVVVVVVAVVVVVVGFGVLFAFSPVSTCLRNRKFMLFILHTDLFCIAVVEKP